MTYPDMSECSYSVFSKELHSKAAEQRIPIAGSIELTSQCNLRCRHCYVVGTTASSQKHSQLPSQILHNLIDEVAHEGCLWLTFTGGEVLARHDFTDIYLYAKRKGLIITLFTNGTLLTPRLADFLAEYPPFRIDMSLYGMSEDTYCRFTGVPGSYQRAMRAIDLMLERKLSLQLKTILTTITLSEVMTMKRFAKGLGLLFRYDPFVTPDLDGGKAPSRVRLTPEEIVSFEMADEERMASWRKFVSKRKPQRRGDNLYNCGAGTVNFHINSSGHLLTCALGQEPGYSLVEGSFHYGFYELFPRIRAQGFSRPSPCRECRISYLCPQCPVWGRLETGDPERPVGFLCKVAHQMARALGVGPEGGPPEMELNLPVPALGGASYPQGREGQQ